MQCNKCPLKSTDVDQLWLETIGLRRHTDDQVNVRCVSEEEIRRLNQRYRGKETPTNVLTFSYSSEHDVALCLSVAEREAEERGVSFRDYVALLLTHAFLHVTGMDHERSPLSAARTKQAEEKILQQAGFLNLTL